jgi:hypothetical protein
MVCVAGGIWQNFPIGNVLVRNRTLARKFPDRETLLAPSFVLADNFPNGK